MNIKRPEDNDLPTDPGAKSDSLKKIFRNVILPGFTLAIGVLLTIYLINTSPEAKPASRPPVATLVEIHQVESGPQQTMLEAMGEIIPSRQIDLKPLVGGQITYVDTDFLPGGIFAMGQSLLQIDSFDYKLVIRQLESEVAKAESDLALEMGNQRIAEKEYDLLGETVSPEERALILRQPQLAKLRANLDSAKARLEQAKINLQRTTVSAPFEGIIQSRDIDLGAKVTESTVLGKFIGTESFWLRLSLPVELLPWIEIPAANGISGSPVRIYGSSTSAPASFRAGEIIRLEPSLEPQGRLAQLLVRVDDPLCLRAENRGKDRLMLGSYVKAEIIGRSIPAAFTIDRSQLHDGNSIWLMDNDGRLVIREVEVLFRTRDRAIVGKGLADGDRIIVSQLASPVPGTSLRIADEKGGNHGGD